MSEHTVEKIEVNREEGYVDKWYKKVENYHNELKWLRQFEGFERCPKYISHDEDEYRIRMTHVGEPLTKDNLPDDWFCQCCFLLEELKKFGCHHGDIDDNVMVKDGKLYLIDFEYAKDFQPEFANKSRLTLLWVISAVEWGISMTELRKIYDKFVASKTML